MISFFSYKGIKSHDEEEKYDLLLTKEEAHADAQMVSLGCFRQNPRAICR